MLAFRGLVATSLSFLFVLALAAPASAGPGVTLEFWKAALTMEIQVGAAGGPIAKRTSGLMLKGKFKTGGGSLGAGIF